MRDMQILPKLSDSISFLYLEQVVIHRNQNTVEAIDQEGRILIPVAALSVLMLGPGVSISHAAINILAKNGCSIVWVGEDATRFYAAGMGESYKAYKVIHQAELVSDPDKRKKVVLAMYLKRFDVHLDHDLSLPQIRDWKGCACVNATRNGAERPEWNGKAELTTSRNGAAIRSTGRYPLQTR